MNPSSNNVGSIEYDARIKTTELKKDAAEVDRLAKNSGDSIGKNVEDGSSRAGHALKTFAKVAAVALAAATVGAVAFGVSSVKAFEESQNAIAQTEAVLKSTNQVAGVTAKTVTDLANSLQKQTRFSDETIRSAENMLLTFTNIGKNTFPTATKAVLDMATAMHEDLQTTAIRVGKALQDPVKGVTALQKVGVRLTDTQKDLVKSLVDAGDTAGAQAIILKELQTEFGGSAKAAGQTFAGQLDILKNQLNDVQEGVGLLIIKGITPLIKGFVDLFKAAGGADGIIKTIKATMDEVTPTLKQWWSNISAVATQIGDYLGPKVEALWNTISTKLLPILSELWHNVLEPLIPVIGTALVVALGLALDAINFVIGAFAWLIQGLKDGNPILVILTAAFVGLAAAMAFNAVFNALNVGFATLRLVTIPSVMTSIGLMQAAIMAPLVMPAIAVGAALASIVLVYNKIKETQALLDSVNDSIQKNTENDAKAMQRVTDDYKAGRISKEAYQHFFKSIAQQRATGGPVQAGRSYIVGEKRPEMFVPNTSGTIIPEVPDWGGAGSNANITVNMSGIMSRSKNDERDIAKSLIKRINEELAAKNVALLGNGALA